MSKLSALIDDLWAKGSAAVTNWLNLARGVGVRGPAGGFVRAHVRVDGTAAVILTNKETLAAMINVELKRDGQASAEVITNGGVVAGVNVLPSGYAVFRCRTQSGEPVTFTSDDLHALFGGKTGE